MDATMKDSNVILLNDIICKINKIDDLDIMRKTLLDLLQYLVQNDLSTFFLASSEHEYKLDRPIRLGGDDDLPERLKNYVTSIQDLDYTRWTFAAPTAGVYRESDLLPEEERIQTPFYQNVFVPNKMHYSMFLTLIYNETFYGAVNLYRSKDKPDFSDEDVFCLDLLNPHLCYRMFQMQDGKELKNGQHPKNLKRTALHRGNPKSPIFSWKASQKKTSVLRCASVRTR